MAAARQTSSRVSAGDSVSTRPSMCNRRVGVSSHRPLAIDSVSSLFGLLGGGAGVASDRLGQRRGVEGLFQQGCKEHARFGLLADLFGIGTQQQHRLAGHAWVQADLAGEVQTAAIG